MQNSLRQALQAQVTFEIWGMSGAGAVAKKLAFLPGVYDATKQITDGTSKETVIALIDPTDLQNAGYAADQVADDYNENLDATNGQFVRVQGVGRIKYRDFLNTIQRVGASVTKIVIKNLAGTSNEEIFDQQLEVAKTVIGAKGGMDFITLQDYVLPTDFDRSKITIDLSGLDENGISRALELTPEVFLAMNIPANAHFSIQFKFNTTVSGMA